MKRWKLISAALLVIFVAFASQVEIIYSGKVVGLKSGDQVVLAFKYFGHWCLGYYRNVKRGGPCDLALATDGNEVFFQRMKDGKPRVKSIIRLSTKPLP